MLHYNQIKAKSKIKPNISKVNVYKTYKLIEKYNRNEYLNNKKQVLGELQKFSGLLHKNHHCP